MPPLSPVDRPRFINRTTLCPVCLKACDLQLQDIVPYYPTYLSPFDTLRAYDGFYHRACLYRVGDYGRMVQAWHQGERMLADSMAQVIGIERDFAVLHRTDTAPLELLLFPRFATWRFSDRATLAGFRALLATGRSRIKGLTRTPVADQPMTVLRWEIPLTGQWHLTGESRPRPPYSVPAHQSWDTSSQLDPAIEWDLSLMDAKFGRLTGVERGWRVPVTGTRLMFVPLYNDEASAMEAFLHDRHREIDAILPR